ncbi:MAG: hypothetical protein PHX40_04130 [Bacilli bacterium]|nr:hypothetical protein [Bacilli bacterium]
MSGNIIIDIINKQEQERKSQPIVEWGIFQRNKLVSVLEQNGVIISDSLYDMLLFNVNGLRINNDGKLCYLSFYPESKKIMKLLRQNNELIKSNFNFITRQ